MPLKLSSRRLFAIGAALVCAAGIGVWMATRPPPRIIDKAQLYDVTLGDWKNKKSKPITYYWSASSPKSIETYRKVISPVMNSGDPDVGVLLIQILDNDVKDDNGPGGLMLCPKNLSAYAKLVADYLNNAENVNAYRELAESKSKPMKFLTNATLEEEKKLGLVDPAACMDDSYFWSRLILQLWQNKKFFLATPIKQLPQVAINGAYMTPEDPRVGRFIQTVRRTKSAVP